MDVSWQLILFSYKRMGYEIWTIDPGTGETDRKISPNDDTYDIVSPAVSPMGDIIAYVRRPGFAEREAGRSSELWLMDRDGTNPRPLYVSEEGVLHRPKWQPDGQAIYFQHAFFKSASLVSLRRIPVTGGEPRTLLRNCLDYAISPDGELLVSAPQDGRLLLSNRDGKNTRDITPETGAPVYFAFDLLAFSPDGRQLAFRGSTSGRDTWNLYVMDLADLKVRRLTDLASLTDPFTSSSGEVTGLAWTADRTRLVYSVGGHPEQAGIWVIDVEGDERRRLFTWEEGGDEWAVVVGPWFHEQP